MYSVFGICDCDWPWGRRFISRLSFVYTGFSDGETLIDSLMSEQRASEPGGTEENLISAFQFTVTMPLIPGYKTSVAEFCLDPSNKITGGYIRWQSMDTIYAIKYMLVLTEYSA
jgi:hypothetical protein